MDYAFEFEQVVSIISAPFTVNEQFCLGELLLCSIRQKKKKTLIFWLWVFAGMTMWLLSGGGSSLPAWRSSLQRIHVVASLPLFSSSLRFPLLPLVLLNGVLPQLLSFATSSSSSLSGVFHRLHRFLFMLHLLFVSSPLSTHSTPGFSTNPSTSTSFMCSSSTFSLSLSFSSVSAGVSLSPLGRVTRVCVSGLPERGGLNEVTSRASRTAVFVY